MISYIGHTCEIIRTHIARSELGYTVVTEVLLEVRGLVMVVILTPSHEDEKPKPHIWMKRSAFRKEVYVSNSRFSLIMMN